MAMRLPLEDYRGGASFIRIALLSVEKVGECIGYLSVVVTNSRNLRHTGALIPLFFLQVLVPLYPKRFGNICMCNLLHCPFFQPRDYNHTHLTNTNLV